MIFALGIRAWSWEGFCGDGCDGAARVRILEFATIGCGARGYDAMRFQEMVFGYEAGVFWEGEEWT